MCCKGRERPSRNKQGRTLCGVHHHSHICTEGRQPLEDDGDSKEERKDKKSSCQVKELVQVHKDGVYLSVLSFALKQAGVDVSTMLRKVLLAMELLEWVWDEKLPYF